MVSALADLTSGATKEGKHDAHQLWLGSVSGSPPEQMIFAHVKSYDFKIKVHFWEPKKALHPLPDSVAYIAGTVSFMADTPDLELEVRATSIRWYISATLSFLSPPCLANYLAFQTLQERKVLLIALHGLPQYSTSLATQEPRIYTRLASDPSPSTVLSIIQTRRTLSTLP
jgi:hypothetical protein